MKNTGTIKAQNISYSYPDKTIALKNVSFEIEKGESVALLGENGAGKSTLIMMLSGFIFPESGILNIDSINVNQKNVKDIRKKVGIIFQDADDQIFMPSVYEDIAFGVINMGLKEDSLKNRIDSVMEETNTEYLKDKEPSKISSGEKRRVAIAGVLAMKKDIIIMDEPTTSLDYKSKKNLIKIINNIKSTKIIATHNMDFAYSVADKAIVLYKKNVAYFGNIKEISNDVYLLEKYNLEPPYRLLK